MSFEQYEYSTSDGSPIALYQFTRGGTQSVYYTNADQIIEMNGHQWQPIAISDNGISAGDGGSLDITLPSTSKVAKLFRGVPPSSPLTVQIFRFHLDDETRAFRSVWVGTISDAQREQADRTKLITTNVASTFTRSGLRLTWGRGCPHSLYNHHCRVNPENYVVKDVVITALDGASIKVTLPKPFPEGWFSGGYIQWLDDGVEERRGLRVHEGDKLSLFGGTDRLAVGTLISLFPGCDRTAKTCSAKFNNMLNYGGCPHMPGKSPFETMKLF